MTPLTQAATDLHKLKDFFLKNAPTCVHKPEGKLKYTYVTPTYAVKAGADDKSDVPERSSVGHYLQMYDWDACFFSQAAHRVGVNNLADAVVSNFLSLKEPDGYVPRTVSPHRVWDAGDMCKPFLCQALVHDGTYKKNPKSPELLQDLECYLGYFERTRRDSSGLFHWRNVLESGVDDNYALLAPQEAAKDENEAVGSFPDGKLLAVDLSAYLAAEYSALSELYAASGNAAKSKEYAQKSEQVAEAIDKNLWNERLGMYCNAYPRTFEHVTLRAWTGLAPLIAGVAKPARVTVVIENNILNEQHFLRPSGLSSLAASEPLYNNAKRGTYGRVICSNWQGPMWVLPNTLIARALVKHGYKDAATDLARRVTSTMMNGLATHGTLFENYSSETGEPLWAPQFMSWNILTLELLDLLI